MRSILLRGMLLGVVLCGLLGVVSALSYSPGASPVYMTLDTPGTHTVGDVLIVTGNITAEGVSTFGNVWAINFGPDEGSSSSPTSFSTRPTLKNHGVYTFGASKRLSYSIPTAGLAPGSYAVEVTASAREGSTLKTTSSWVYLTLVAPGQPISPPSPSPTPAPTTIPSTATPTPATTVATTPPPTPTPGFEAIPGLLALGCALLLRCRRRE